MGLRLSNQHSAHLETFRRHRLLPLSSDVAPPRDAEELTHHRRPSTRRVVEMIRTCSLLFLAATIPSIVHGFSFEQTGCSAHADCGSDAYCYDSGLFTTGDLNGVGYCDFLPSNCCGGEDADPIDGDVGNCPAASQCESTTATASNCEDVCEGHGYKEAHCLAVSDSCAWTNNTCRSSVNANACSYYTAQADPRERCTAHANCDWHEYCSDSEYANTGEWSGEGYCSRFPSQCCAGGLANPIDRDVANCPAMSWCDFDTSTASSCVIVCEGHGYDETQCAAASPSCEWEDGSCVSGVGANSCEYYLSDSFHFGDCFSHEDCGSDEYCYDSGYFLTGEWDGVGYCSSYPPLCCGGSGGDPIDRDVSNCPAASRCESTTATASNCEDICEGHDYSEAHCLAVSESCRWDDGACWSGVGPNSCSYFPAQTEESAAPKIFDALFAIVTLCALALNSR